MKAISTPNAPAAIGPYVQGKIVGNLLFTSGQIPLNPQTGEIVGDDINTQTECVLKNLSAVIQAANKNLQSVVKTTCFLSDMNNFASFNAIYSKYFDDGSGQFPARSCVAVRELPKSVLVEIEAVVDIS